MKQLITFLINKHRLIVTYVFVLIIIALITLLYPRTNFKYEYELGKPWNYEDLLAPSTFTIKKLEDSVKAEQMRLRESFRPFYTNNLSEKMVDDIILNVAQTYETLKLDTNYNVSSVDSIRFTQIARSLLDTIYNRGVINLADIHKQPDGVSPDIKELNYLIRPNEIVRRSYYSFFTSPSFACRYIEKYIKSLQDTNALAILPIMCESLEANVLFDQEKTDEIQKALLDEIVPTDGKVVQGEIIVMQGQVVTNDSETKIYQKLKTIEELLSTAQSDTGNTHFLNKYRLDIGYFLITFTLLGIFMFFMRTFARQHITRLREIGFLLLAILSFLYLVSIITELQQVSMPFLSLYVIPFCIVPIIVRSFFGSMVAHYVHIIIMTLSYFIIPLGFEFLLLHFIAGLVAILTNEKTYYWSDFFRSTALIFITYCIGYFALSLIYASSIETIKWPTFGWLVVNALLTLLAFQLIPIFEKIFGFLSNITLMELGDLNNPLLKQLSQKAPGTFWHSLQVSNLAEAASSEIGGNAMLAKVGALYHDIGKMRNPAYFIENQKTALNPHDDLPYEESAHIIIEHVTYGIELAKKENLPNIIIDFIRTHHGDTRTEYFYRQYIQQHPDEVIDDQPFRYPGPLPYSKETAIVMMADSVEAASRSLKNPNEDDINNLVEGIVEGKIKLNQFVNCDISFKDITAIKKVFKRQLRSIYHVRISYPTLEKSTV